MIGAKVGQSRITRPFRSYRHYKNSGADWLGEIPAHWKVKPFKALLVRNDGGVWGEDFDDNGVIVLRSTEQTVDGRWSIENPARRRLTAREVTAGKLEVGDLVVTKSSGSELHIGKASIVDQAITALNCCFSNFMQRLRVAPSNQPRLFWYLLNSPVAREQFIYLSSTTTGLGNLNGSMLGTMRVAVAPEPEQRTIVAFLDRETAKIDTLIAKKERLIELLQEKRSALITRAVTKGLDPNVPIKDSGVEWVGQIPAHWEVQRNRYLFRESDRRSESGDEELLTVSHITGVTRRSEKEVHMIEAESHEGYKLCAKDELAINTMWAWMGALGIAWEDGMVSPSYNVYRITSPRLTPRYYDYLCRIPIHIEEIIRHSKGIWGSRLRLYPEPFSTIMTPLPPRSEQTAIAKLLDREISRIDALVERVREGIERLKEYRTALISAAVTGKIDVREETS